MSGQRMGLLVCCLLALSPALGIQGPPAYAGLDGDVELLRLVAEGNRANRESIVSWQGRARTVWGIGGGESVAGVTASTSEAEFVWSSAQGARRWRLSMTGPGTEQAAKEQEVTVDGMVVDGTLSVITTFSDQPGKLRALTIRPVGDVPVSRRTPDFDPMHYLGRDGEDMHDQMVFYFENAAHPKIQGLVTREGDIVALERPLGDWVSRYVFDLSKGCNLIAYRMDGPASTGTWDAEYEAVDGVFVPVKVVKTHVERDENGRQTRSTRSEVTFEGNEVNQPLAPGEFTLRALGVRNGDRVQDDRLLLTYTCREEDGIDTQLDPADEPQDPPPATEDPAPPAP